MPRELMEAFEQLRKATKDMNRSFNLYYELSKDLMCVYFTDKNLLPEGQYQYKYVESIDSWYKTVMVNNVMYYALLTDEEYKKEVA